jgi:RHS repeat-associated protein
MKKTYLLLAVFIAQFAVAQTTGTPVTGVTQIKRVVEPTTTAQSAIAKTAIAPTSTARLAVNPAPTGTSTEVGITEGQLSVSLTGGATYNIPIAVPPGINGVVPQISLAYNSQGGNGMAGYGWNIAGVSAITRIPKTQFHDGAVGGVNLDANDRFALDGQRLIAKTGVYGASGTVYETENFSNLKITSVGVSPLGANYGPASFKVEYPDGSVAEYGSTTDSRSVTTWSISYWQNPQGVRISYNYNYSNGTTNITSIRYGAVGVGTPINQINFVYGTRARPEQAYVGGQSIANILILDQINVVGNGLGFRNYTLNYDSTSLNYQRLTKITEYSGDVTKTYNPTVFSYETTPNEITNKKITTDYSYGADLRYNATMTGDFNGDGSMDYVLYPTTGTKNKFTYFKNLDGVSTSGVGAVINSGTFIDIFANSWLTNENKVSSKQGITTIHDATGNLLNNANVEFRTYSEDKYTSALTSSSKFVKFPAETIPGGCVNLNLSGAQCSAAYVQQVFNKKYLSGDFNGDGITDVIAIDIGAQSSQNCGFNTTTGKCQIENTGLVTSKKVYFVDLKINWDTNNTPVVAGYLNSIITSTSDVQVIDFNGDGKSDFMIRENGSVIVYGLNDTNQLVVLTNLPDTAIVLDSRPCLVGDYNGDGKSDFIIPKFAQAYDDHTEWLKFTSTGTTFDKQEQNYPNITYPPNLTSSFEKGISNYRYIPTDYDNDGKTDLVLFNCFDKPQWTDVGLLGTVKIVVRYNKNGVFDTSTLALLSSLNVDQTYGLDGFSMPIFYSSNQPNRKLEIAVIKDNYILYFKSKKDFSKDKLLNLIITGNGVRETITYKPLFSDGGTPNLYTPTLGISTYPNTDIAVAPGFQVVSMLEKQSVSVYKKQLFSYAGATSNMQGLGFLGFRASMRTNWFNDSTTANITSSVSKFDPDLRGANTENYTYLGLESPATIATQTAPNTGIPNAIVKKDYTQTGTETLTASGSILLQPGTTGTLIKPTTGNAFIAKVKPNYDSTGFAETNTTPASNLIMKTLSSYEATLSPSKVYKLQNVQSKNYNLLDNTSSETNTVYDIYNNPTVSNTKLKNSGIDEQVTVATVTYDNQPTGTIYYVGRPTSKVQTATGSGDSMTSTENYGYTNHLLSQIRKKGNNTNEIVEDNIYDTFGNITQKTITAAPLTPRITNYKYDTTGCFLIESTDIEGLKTTFVYNPNGTLKSETNPYALTTSYEYDSWFKKTKTTDYLGKLNTYAYLRNGEKTKITTTGGDDDSYSEELFDDMGRKIKTGVKDLQGNMSYKDYSYDIYDRNFKVSESYASSASQWNTTNYDVYGRPITATAFTGKVVSMVYDKLKTTVTDNSTSKTKASTKNAMGNVITMVETVPDTPAPQTVNYSYFANGNLKETNYDGTKITITQDGWGRKTTLNDPSAGLYTYAYNALGESTQETTPNGTTTYNLDPATGKLMGKTIVGTKTNSSTTYEYDAVTKLMKSSLFTNVLENNSITNTVEYDLYKRVAKTTETTPYAKFEKTIDYDAWGRPNTETSIATLGNKSSTTSTKNNYKNGYAYQMVDNKPSGVVLWQTDEVNARGQVTKAKLGNTIAIINDYDPYGYVTNMKHTLTTSTVMELGTVFDIQRGNLKSRTNSLFGTTDIFGYDAQDRLTSYPNALGLIENQTYKPDGRIDANTLGTYNYNTAKKYQNTSVTLTPEATGYYANREGIFSDSMESKKDWALPDPVNYTYDTTEKHSGNTSLKIANTTTVKKVIHAAAWTKIDNIVSTAYTYSVWVKSNGPQPELFLFMKTETETGYFTLVDSKITDVKNQWVKIEGTYSVPANIKKLGLRLDNNGIGSNGLGNVWFDDVQIRKGDATTALVSKQVPDADYKDHKLDITYNTFKSPVEISEAGVDKISFTYNDGNDRSTMVYGGLGDKSTRQYRKHYSADGTMEIKENLVAQTVEFVTYLGGDGYSAPVVVKCDGVTQNYLYLHRDYQGSILAITNSAGQVLEKRLFDAWGNIAKVQDGAGNTLNGLTVLDRGYTGHEHLLGVGLINMNGRLYDPKLHRFLSPDNYVQDPSNMQNYNRYGYCINNPLKYRDISGESFWSDLGDGFSNAFKSIVKTVVTVATVVVAVAIIATAITIGTTVGIFQSVGSGFQNNSILTNEARILGGLFQGNIGQIASRFTKELPQTLLGLGMGLAYNAIGRVKSVSYYGGATAIETYDPRWGAYTLGSFIIGENGIQASTSNSLFKHEYGHYLQSQDVGWNYIYDYAIPSAIDAKNGGKNDIYGYNKHDAFWVEQDANIRGRDYFGTENWDYEHHPIFGSGQNTNFDRDYGYLRRNNPNFGWWLSLTH